MSKPIHLAFLWHMHQPWYLDPPGGKLLLPWVRLHGVSAYLDMARLLETHEHMRTVINFSPSLLDQIQHYSSGVGDIYEDLTLREAAELTAEERHFLLRHFFSVHWTGVLSGMPRYLELLEKRGRDMPQLGDSEVADRFSVPELRDLQVLFNLAWFGSFAAEDAEIQELLHRGKGYTEADKRTVLNKQRETLEQVLPAWKRLVGQNRVEVMCSPYYHPILPLLVDSHTAKRSNPELRLPERFCFPQDAELQISRAIQRVQQEFGVQPEGMWPSEAAISPETVQLVQKLGLRYLVTDAEILFRSLDDRGSTPGRRRLCQPYRVGESAVFFRHSALSALIAKEYCSWRDPQAAVVDFLQKVRETAEIARIDGDAPPLVLIALDGENPWEAYPNRGRDFLGALYQQLARAEEIQTVTLTEHLTAFPPVVGLEHLHSGSWIEANFAIWIGDPDKNRAWNLLGRARRRLARAQTEGTTPPAALEQAMTHALWAEGSDWFWWLGEPFSSAEDGIFDTLFRSHLGALYSALGDSPPADLSRPISFGGVVDPLRQPTGFIQPRIDGTRTSYFEWRSAGFYRVPAGLVGQEHTFITGLYWGFDAGRFYLRLDPVEEFREGMAIPMQELQIWLELTVQERRIIGRLKLSPPPSKISLQTIDKSGRATDLGNVEEVAFLEVVELSIPLSRLGLRAGTRAGLSLHFAREGVHLVAVPRQGVIEVEIPGDDFGGSVHEG